MIPEDFVYFILLQISAKEYAADSGNAANWQFLPIDRSQTPVEFVDPNMYYHPNGYTSSAYYYGGWLNRNKLSLMNISFWYLRAYLKKLLGCDGSGSDWEDYSRYASEGVDIANVSLFRISENIVCFYMF